MCTGRTKHLYLLQTLAVLSCYPMGCSANTGIFIKTAYSVAVFFVKPAHFTATNT